MIQTVSTCSLIELFFEELCGIAPEFYFVPGNHDPDYSFSVGHHERNAHLNPSEIADHLYVVGVGGAKPGYTVSESGKKTPIQWGAWPYVNE